METKEAPFVTAEDTQSARGVWVLLETYSLVIAGEVRPVRFVVTTSTGYRAELEACLLDFCAKERVNCIKKIDYRGLHSGMSVNKWCEHIKTHCHGYHLAKAQAFRDQVLRTYTHPLPLR
jgi:hypothetical protein